MWRFSCSLSGHIGPLPTTTTNTSKSLYSLIWDFLLSQINIWTTTTWSNVWVVLPKPSWYEFLIGFLIWTSASKYLHLTIFSKMCVILSMFLYFVTVSKCPKSPKLTNIVILTFGHLLLQVIISGPPEYSDTYFRPSAAASHNFWTSRFRCCFFFRIFFILFFNGIL